MNNRPKLIQFPVLQERGIAFTQGHLNRLEAEGRFPKRIRLSHRVVAWVESEIDDYINSKIEARAA